MIAVPLMCLVILSLSWRTHLRNLDYRSGVALWTDTIAKRPENPRAHYCLGLELRRLGKTTEAQAEFATAVDIGIPVAEFYVALADGQRAQGQPAAAIANYHKAIRLKPGLPQAHNGLGATLHSQGRLEDARTAFEAATELNLPQARYNLAAVLIDLEDDEAAVPILWECLEAHPQFERPARRLAWIYATSSDESLLDGERALQVLAEHCQVEESGSPFVWDTYAAALARVGRFNEASVAARRAIELAANAERDELHDRIEQRLLNYDSGQAWPQAKENQS
jgi:Flp pilus assembly protein TadD